MTDVLVVGAGPTGLALALDLARRGVAVRIVDKADKPFAGSRGKGITARTQEVFDDFGIVDELNTWGFQHMPHRVEVRGKVVVDGDPTADLVPTPDRPYEAGVIIPQFRTEQILRQRLSELGIQVEYGVELVSFKQTADAVQVTFRDQEPVQVPWLVGCDGGRSTIRKSLKLSFEGENSWQGMLLGDIEIEGLEPDRWYQWTHPDRGFVALCPFKDSSVWQFQGVPFADFREDGQLPEPGVEYFQQIVENITDRTDITLSNPTWLSTYRVNVRMIDRYRTGRIFVAGDAAHVHSPAGGLGMNTGIQDAYNLGWKLGRVVAGADPALLDTYHDERLPIAEWTLGISSSALDTIVDGVGSEEWKGLTANRSPDGHQLSLAYPWSSLSKQDPDVDSKVRAGDRAPDAPCTSSEGDRVRLFDVFRGPHFTLLGFGSSVDGLDSTLVKSFVIDTDLIDDGGHARSAYGIAGDALVLVRPDGYVGVVAAAENSGLVRDYLAALNA